MRPRTPEQNAAHEAMDRITSRGFSAFRNGKIVSPKGHVMTDEDKADFALIVAAFPYSKLL